MTLFSGISMRWKLVLTSTAIGIIMLAILVWNGLRLIDETLAHQLELRQQEVSVLLNAAIAPAMATQDYAPIADVLSQSRRHDGIQYFILTDSRGKPLLSEGWDLETPPPSIGENADFDTPGALLATQIPITLSGQTYGQLHFGISTQFLQDAHAHLTRQSLSIAGAEIILSLILLSGLAFLLTRHLDQLKRASEAVGRGHYNIELNINSQDEIGQLAKAFSQMTQQIEGQYKALRDSEARFRSLLNLSTDLYWEQDSDFRFTDRRTGWASESQKNTAQWLLGKRRWEFETTLSDEQWAAHRAHLEAHEVFRELEYGVRLPDGTLRYYHVHGEPFFDNKGHFAGYRGTAVDITQRKLAENSLQLAASVFAEAHEGIVITDPHWRIVDLNPMASELTGYGRIEVLGTDLRQYYVGDDINGFNQQIVGIVSETGHWRGEAIGIRKSGEHFPELLTVSVVRSQSGDIANHILIFSDITALKEQQSRLEALAHFDALTRLPNRVLLADRMSHAIHLAQRDGELLAVAYLDLDGFKPVNDTLGHDAGDQLLIEVANRLRLAIRKSDTVARLGGDEFVLLLRADDFGDCEAALIRVLNTLSTDYQIKGQSVSISASIGVTLYPRDTADPDLLLRHADQAMYVAKQAGRNRYHFFDAELDYELRDRHARIARVQAGLHAQEFVLHYQPKIDMRDGNIIGAEALIRWQHPERGLLPPSEFLPLIEDNELAIPLGEWVIATALAQMADWQAMGIRLPISVNIAPRQLQAPDFPARLRALLADYASVPADWLELEIVETTALEDLQHVSTILRECLATGVSFALDDFGTGYSSLTYFKRLPAKSLKIDRSFIRDMLSDPEDLAIVEGVIGLAQTFRREVIAEGVETLAHGQRLLELGCHFAQGYGIARPMAAQDIPAWRQQFEGDSPWKLAPPSPPTLRVLR